MKKLFLLLLFVAFGMNAQWFPTTGVNYIKFAKVPPTATINDSIFMYASDGFGKMMTPSAFLQRVNLQYVLSNGNTSTLDAHIGSMLGLNGDKSSLQDYDFAGLEIHSDYAGIVSILPTNAYLTTSYQTQLNIHACNPAQTYLGGPILENSIGVILSNNYSGFRGISLEPSILSTVIANVQDPDYVPKKYVDDLFASGGSSGLPGTLAADNHSNQIAIISNNGKSELKTNDSSASLRYNAGAGVVSEINMTGDHTLIEADSSFIDLSGGVVAVSSPNFTWNGDIVATLPDLAGISADASGDGIDIVSGVIDVNDLVASTITTTGDIESTGADIKAPTGTILGLNANVTSATASTISIFDASKNIVSADTATYPSLTELSYGKGVTSAIQTQLNAKEPSISGTGFVYSTSGTKSVVSDTGTGNVVRDTAPTLSGLITYSGGTLTGASATTMFANMTGTFNGTGVFKGIFENITNTASNSQSRLIDLQTNSSSKFNVDMLGNAYASNSLTAGAYVEAGSTAFVSWTGRSRVYSPANGDFRLTNAAGTDFGKLQFGGTTSSFPAVKRNGATLEIRLADDSEFAAVQTLYDRFGSGSPEGVVTAPVGASYHRTDGGAGTSLYAKESGTGNTGWVAK